MKKKLSIQRLCAAALLIALGVVLPLFSPLKIVMPPASFTLASHVAIFVAMMISPGVAAAVSVGTTLGFLFGGFPLVIVLRAATHVVFALLGAFHLKRRPATLDAVFGVRVFSLVIGVTHAACEVLVVTPFYFGGQMVEGYYQSGYLQAVILLVGLGSVIHSMVDFELALLVARVLRKQKSFTNLIVSTT